MNRSGRQAALAGLGLALLLVGGLFLSGWSNLVSGGLFARFELLSKAPDTWQAAPDGGSFGKSLLEQAGLNTDARMDVETLLAAQQWLGEQVCCVEVSGSRTSQALWDRARAGKGLSCGAMAQLFHEMVSATGTPARVVQLYRSDFDPTDTHVLVEVMLGEGGWAVFDPTFNLTYRDTAGKLLGVQDIRGLLKSARADQIVPLDHGRRTYPASIDTYYLDWRVLFGNAYVVRPCPDCAFWQRLPPLRHWLGPVRYAFGDGLGPLAREHNHHYFTVVVVYPLLGAVLLLALVRVWLGRRGD